MTPLQLRDNRTQVLFYLLLRDHLPSGTVHELVDSIKGDEYIYTSKPLAQLAADLRDRLFKPVETTSTERLGLHPTGESEPFAETLPTTPRYAVRCCVCGVTGFIDSESRPLAWTCAPCMDPRAQ